MSASRGDSVAWLGSSCSPVRNESINRLSLQREEGGLFSACEKWEGIVRFRSGWSAGLRHSQQDRLAGCHTAAWRHQPGKASDRSVCAGCGGEGCHGLFWRKAVLYNNDLAGKQAQKCVSNRAVIKEADRQNAPSTVPVLGLWTVLSPEQLKISLTRARPRVFHPTLVPAVSSTQWSWCQQRHLTEKERVEERRFSRFCLFLHGCIYFCALNFSGLFQTSVK